MTLRPAFAAIIALVAAVAVTGCGILLPSPRERAARNTPGFRSGYSDGCASANAQDTKYREEQVRDENLYATDQNYRAGWASGFTNCRRDAGRPITNRNSGPIPDNQPGGH